MSGSDKPFYRAVVPRKPSDQMSDLEMKLLKNISWTPIDDDLVKHHFTPESQDAFQNIKNEDLISENSVDVYELTAKGRNIVYGMPITKAIDQPTDHSR